MTLYISLPQKREDKKKNEEFSTKPYKTQSENIIEMQNPQECISSFENQQLQ